MISKKEASKILKRIKKDYKTEIPVVLQLSEMTSISSFSIKLVTNRIAITNYNDRYASKRNFYKATSIKHPNLNEQ